jgi:hypothetical protein
MKARSRWIGLVMPLQSLRVFADLGDFARNQLSIDVFRKDADPVRLKCQQSQA